MTAEIKTYLINSFNIRKLSPHLTQSEANYLYHHLSLEHFYAAWAEADGHMAGLIFCPPDREEHASGILLFRVLPQYRRLGVGTALVKFIAQVSAQYGQKVLYASYTSEQECAVSFFRSLPGTEQVRNIAVKLLSPGSIRKALNIPLMKSARLKEYENIPLKEHSDSLSVEEKERMQSKAHSYENPNIFLQRQVFYPPVFEEGYSEKYSEVILHHGVPVAWVLSMEYPEEKRLKICKMFVEPQYRDKGAFAKMATDLLSMALDDGYCVDWWVMHWTHSFFIGCQRWQKRAGLDVVTRYYVKTLDFPSLLGERLPSSQEGMDSKNTTASIIG